MTETRATYHPSTQWFDLRFDDGKHTGVRVLRGTTVIEIMREGRKKLVDITECLPLEQTENISYTK